MIKEVIVVEGRDDVIRVKEAMDCDAIPTHGFRLSKSLIQELKTLEEKRGLIILTDPDTAGRKIRERLKKEFPTAKHAYLPKNKAIKGGDIGIENADKKDIRNAIKKAKAFKITPSNTFDASILFKYRLTGPSSKEKREVLAEKLGLGSVNAKELIKRLNSFEITMEEFLNAIREIEEDKNE